MPTDREAIQSVISEALAGAGGMLVRIFCKHMSMWLEAQGEDVTIAMAVNEAGDVAKAAENVSANSHRWIKDGRYNQSGYGQFVRSTVSPGLFEMYYLLGERLYALDQMFREQFSVESAQHFLSQIMEVAVMFQDDLGKWGVNEPTEI